MDVAIVRKDFLRIPVTVIYENTQVKSHTNFHTARKGFLKKVYSIVIYYKRQNCEKGFSQKSSLNRHTLS